MKEAGYFPANFHIYTGNFVAEDTSLQMGEHFLAGERADLSAYCSLNLDSASENAHSALYFQCDFAQFWGRGSLSNTAGLIHQ